MKNIKLSIAYARGDQQHETAVELPAGTTLQQGLMLLTGHIADLLNGEQPVATGVWGKVRPSHYVLREGDRIELYRALKADPKDARRVRAHKKASRS